MSDDKPTPTKSRPAPGERRIQILQTLAQMLETPGGERVTTALLAKRLDAFSPALARKAARVVVYDGTNKLNTKDDKPGLRGLYRVLL